MVHATLIPIVDALATIGFLAAAGIGIANYRDTDLEQTFWAVFVGVSVTGAIWMGLVTVEWVGIQGALMDSLSTSLQSIVIGVFSIGAVGTMAVVQDLKRSGAETERQRRDANRARQEAEHARATAEEERTKAEELSDHLQAKARTFGTVMGRAADGDLTERMEPDPESAAMTSIAEAFNDMMTEFENTFAQLRRFADQVAASSEQVTSGAGESQSASEQVSESIQAISADADSQSERLGETAAEMQSLSGTVEEVASSAEEIAVRSEETADLGRTGRRAAGDAMTEMSAIEVESSEAIEDVESLAAEIAAISEITDLITDIAEQTNMLALNASIEAARVGKAGEGFAVVANEIKELASETADATENIESQIDLIQSTSNDALSGIRTVDRRIASGADTVEEALAALDDIADTVEEANRGIQEISDATDDQAGSTEEVASMVDDVAESARQVSRESNTVSAAAEEQTSSLTEVSRSASTLSERAIDLRERLSAFSIGSASTDAGPTGGGLGTSDGPAGASTAADGGHRLK
jgi:methyl-accepting chemotaxis protein